MTISAILDEFKSIDQLKITEIKAYGNPPKIISHVLESVLVLLNKDSTITQARRLLGT